jgi:hypothetical protein
MQVGKLQSGDEGTWQQETRMLLRTLRTRDPDVLAEGFLRWELRFRQLGGGSFRGELQFLQLGGTQVLRAAGNRRLQAQGASARKGYFLKGDWGGCRGRDSRAATSAW